MRRSHRAMKRSREYNSPPALNRRARTSRGDLGRPARPTLNSSASPRSDMLTWVLYDIVKDRARDKAAKACLQSGLYRVQKSVFLGTLADNERDELVLRI